MVAPFLGPLKSWIKDQRRRDRKRMAQANNSISGMEYFTENEDANRLEEKSHMNRLMEDLRRSQLTDRSNNLPEVSMQSGPSDNVAMLKGLLGVGGSTPAGVSLGPMAPGIPPQSTIPPNNLNNMGQPNLMALLLGGNQPTVPSGLPSGVSLNGAIPQTPLDQLATGLPQQPPSPSHHHLRQPHFENQPPPFPDPTDPKFQHRAHQPQATQVPHGPQVPQGPQSQSMASQMPTGLHGILGLTGFQQHQQPGSAPAPPLPQPSQNLPTHTPWFPGPSGHAAGLDMSRRMGETGDSFFNPGQAGHFQTSAVPPASKLPAPKNLSQQAMGLLNAFKNDAPPRPVPNLHRPSKSQSGSNLPQVVSTREKPVKKNNHELDIASLLKDDKKEETSKRSSHQAPEPTFGSGKNVPPQTQLLLDLFRRPGASSSGGAGATGIGAIEKDAGPLSPQPVELSAMASPGVTPKAKSFHPKDLANDKTNVFVNPAQAIQAALSHHSIQSTHSSNGRPAATVSGPLNAPDFDVLHSQSRRNTVNKSEAPGIPPKQQPPVLPPVSILARPKSHLESPSKSPPVPIHSVSPKTKLEAPKPFHPQILKRGQALAASPPAVTIPSIPTESQSNGKSQDPPSDSTAPFDRRDSQTNDQKSTLLSLFGKPSPPQAKASVDDNLGAGIVAATGPVTAPPPNVGTSHVVSPVSPLPEKILQTPRATPPEYAKSSRISSITSNPGSAVDAIKDTLIRSYEARPHSGMNAGSYFSPPNKTVMDPSSGYASQPGSMGMPGRSQPHQSQPSLGTSKDRDFLLGYLQNVGKKGT
jgi:mRNA-decapping enzyme subunit 2